VIAPAPDLPGDPDALDGAVGALLSNARSFDDAAGEIEADGRSLGQSWSGTASDAGQEFLAQLSERAIGGSMVIFRVGKVLSIYATELRAAQTAYREAYSTWTTANALHQGIEERTSIFTVGQRRTGSLHYGPTATCSSGRRWRPATSLR
jgi:hypothetical protein